MELNTFTDQLNNARLKRESILILGALEPSTEIKDFCKSRGYVLTLFRGSWVVELFGNEHHDYEIVE